MADFEIVETTQETTVVVVEQPPSEIISEGIQGPPGPPGNNLVGGFNVVLSNPLPGDLLSFSGDKFINTPPANLTDGGNF